MWNLFFEFKVDNLEKFYSFQKLFYALKEAKNNGTLESDDIKWLDYFDENMLLKFWWPSEKELKEYWKLYYSIPESQRYTDKRLDKGWDFESMIDAIRSGEYELTYCEIVKEGIGRLEFNTWSWPYGSSDALRALINSFDFVILKEEL